jgi:hypothetical protein
MCGLFHCDGGISRFAVYQDGHVDALNSFQHRTDGLQSFDTVVGILSSRPRDRASPQSRLPGVAVLDLVGRLEDNRFFRPCAQNCTATVQMDQERTRSSKASPLLHAASRGASYMCVEAQPEKPRLRNLKKFQEHLPCSGPSAVLKSGCLRASVSGRYRSCRRARR